MRNILSVLILLMFMFSMHQSVLAKPANLAMLSDINIATSVDNTKIKLKFDGKPGREKILYQNDFVQIEFPETYTDPAKQWLKVEDDIVNNIFVYQFDTNTVRVRLFTKDKAVTMRGRVSISKVDNGLMISYGHKPAVAAKKIPVAAKVTSKPEVKKSSNAAPVEIELPETAEKVSPPAEPDSIAGNEEVADHVNENHSDVPSEQLSEEAGTGPHTAEDLPVKQDTGEAKAVLLNDPPGFTGSVIKMVTALGIVLAFLVAVAYLVKKYLGKKIGFAGQEEKIKVVTSTYLGPKKSIALVEVAGEKIVVGVTATHISMLTKIGKDEDFGEVLKEQINPKSTDERVELQDELWEKA